MTSVAIRARLERAIVERLREAADGRPRREQLAAALRESLAAERVVVPSGELRVLERHFDDRLFGLGALAPLLRDERVSEVMVNGTRGVWVERDGRLEETGIRFTDPEEILVIIERLVAPLGRRIDLASPLVDARLPDGSRVHAVIPPISLVGPILTIRRFAARPLAPDDLVRSGTLSAEAMAYLTDAVRARRSILVSGGTSSGKTTTLNALAFAIGERERIVTIEDAAELRMPQANVVALETRVPSVEGTGAVDVRALLRAPSRTILRGGEIVRNGTPAGIPLGPLPAAARLPAGLGAPAPAGHGGRSSAPPGSRRRLPARQTEGAPGGPAGGPRQDQPGDRRRPLGRVAYRPAPPRRSPPAESRRACRSLGLHRVSADNPLRIAVVGSGPAGFYAAGQMLASGLAVEVDLFERLPTPWGLVRFGVAPDHPKIKEVSGVFARTAADPRFRFFGNVEVGSDLTHDELRRLYGAVVYAVGARTDRRMEIPGEDLPGSWPATAFVAWYNGHPDYQDVPFDLSCERAVIVGAGNVAVDVARMLARTAEELRVTDATDQAIAALSGSPIREIVVLARRGPVQAAFTTPELKELGELAGAGVAVDPADLELDPASEVELAGQTRAQRNLAILRDYSARPRTARPRSLRLRFLVSPVAIVGRARVEAIDVVRNGLVRDEGGRTRAVERGAPERLACGLVLRSVGYRGVALPGVPFDDVTGTIPNREGRVVDANGAPLAGVYCVG
ncbi:MAG: ATPase, T2SS/T4P/T4SS family, partial [Candidatus Limnocylindria bacterium]|nr:ATPase, T2SS/T4P/T4SS family [Candidatus Limnocylindria bacterium]